MTDVIKKESAGGVLYSQGKYLVIRWISRGTVELPKGTIEDRETVEHACIREVFEETGYNVEIVCPLTISNFTIDWDDGRRINKTVHYFLLKRIDDLKPTPKREAHEDFANLWLNEKECRNALSFDDMKNAFDGAVKEIHKSEIC